MDFDSVDQTDDTGPGPQRCKFIPSFNTIVYVT